MRSNPFKGSGVALITPFHQNGEVDYDSLANLIEFQIENGTDFLCALGTTAETPALEDSEYQEVLSFIVRQVAGRIPIMAGCSDNCTARLTRKIKTLDFTGVSALLVCEPAYNKPTQEGLYQHFMAVAEASPLPIVLYNVPGRTGVNMTAATTLRLAEASEKFIAVKEASGNTDQIFEIIDRAPAGFSVISGDDSLTFILMQHGACGCISVIANALPLTYGKMIHALADNRIEEAATIHNMLIPLYGLLFQEGNPSGIKALLASRNMTCDRLRLPLVPVSDELRGQIVSCFNIVLK